MSLKVTDRDGSVHEVKAQAGDSLMPVLRDAVDLTIGICGGIISCGTCRVTFDEDWYARLPAPSTDEVEMLDAVGDEPRARLACQLDLTADLDGMPLTIAPAV